MNDDHQHLQLPSGALASVSKDCKPKTIAALDAMAEIAKSAVVQGAENQATEGGSDQRLVGLFRCDNCGADATHRGTHYEAGSVCVCESCIHPGEFRNLRKL